MICMSTVHCQNENLQNKIYELWLVLSETGIEEIVRRRELVF